MLDVPGIAFIKEVLYTDYDYILLTVVFSRTLFKPNKGERWGCSPQTLTRVLRTLDPQ